MTKSHNAQIDTSVDWIPSHLQNSRAFEAPDKLIAFTKKYNITHLVFVDDAVRCERSIRSNSNIFINSRGTYWDAMILPPWLCNSPQEAIFQRFLHEVGHIALKHIGDPNLISTDGGLIIIDRPNDIWDVIRDKKEGDSWKFAFNIRDQQPELYNELLDDIKIWYENHNFNDKDWVEDRNQQWRRITGKELPSDLWSMVPSWVRQEYQKR